MHKLIALLVLAAALAMSDATAADAATSYTRSCRTSSDRVNVTYNVSDLRAQSTSCLVARRAVPWYFSDCFGATGVRAFCKTRGNHSWMLCTTRTRYELVTVRCVLREALSGVVTFTWGS